MNSHLNYPRLWKTALITLALNGLLFVATPRPSFAADAREKCEHRIEKAEARLDDAIRRKGEHSSDAEARRRDLNNEREHCWSEYHGWWDGHAHQWHTEHDWR